ncbi:MAG: hypothetical protein H6667_12515 [Ardenticatenaceae bacterium]|nr:hypothetical protein [Ardenticatenaceae bacterium]
MRLNCMPTSKEGAHGRHDDALPPLFGPEEDEYAVPCGNPATLPGSRKR